MFGMLHKLPAAMVRPGRDFISRTKKDSCPATLQDFLIYNLKGIAVLAQKAKTAGIDVPAANGRFIAEGLFTTITNVNFKELLLSCWHCCTWA